MHCDFLTGQRHVSGDLAGSNRTVEDAVGSFDGKFVGANDQSVQTIFAIPAETFQNQAEKHLAADGQKEKADTTQNNE
jgi:hypothetical protein